MGAARDRLLFVDDEPESRRSFSRLAESAGYCLDVASGVTEAQCLAENDSYAIVVSDYIMPQTNGVETLGRIAAFQPDAVFLLLTAYRSFEISTSSPTAQLVSEVIYKPYTEAVMLEALGRGLALRSRRRAEASELEGQIQSRQKKPLRILLVEDSEADYRQFVDLLRKSEEESSTVTRVSRMSEALLLMDAREHDVVFLDLGLPDAAGLTAVAMSLDRCGARPLFVLSGNHDPSLRRDCLALGAHDFLVKGSYESPQLLRTLTRSRP